MSTSENRSKPKWLAEPMEEIPFNPTEVDVVATKIRTWNKQHAGNIFYRDCILDSVRAYDLSTPEACRSCAQKIFDLLVTERGGRFLKLPEGLATHATCQVLTPKRTVEKIIHALKTARDRIDIGLLGVHPVKTPLKTMLKKRSDQLRDEEEAFISNMTKTKTPALKKRKLVTPSTAERKDDTTRSKQKPKTSKPQKSKWRKPYVKPTDKPSYKAVQGDSEQPIHDYALTLISKVCSQANPATAHQALDQPIGYTMEEEPEQERLMRLQLRQRIVAAQSIGMTPIEFARRLLALWDAKLLQVPAPPGKTIPIPAQQTMQKKVQQVQPQSLPNNLEETPTKRANGNSLEYPTPCTTSSFQTPNQNAAFAFDFKPSPSASPKLPEQKEFLQQLEEQKHLTQAQAQHGFTTASDRAPHDGCDAFITL